MDLVLRAPRIPAPGETVLGASDLARFPGGKGANQAFAAANLGASVYMIGRVGTDDFAAPVLASLTGAGVDTTHVIRDERTATGLGMVVVDARGQNAIVAAAETARQHGVTTVLNPAPAPARPLPADLLSCIDVLIPNETEAKILSGMPVESDADIELAAGALRATGVETIIVTRGSRGCARISRDTLTLHPTFSIRVVDTTAAGDAFVGGFAAALAAGSEIEAAIAQGSAAGALACTQLGAQASLPDRAEVDRLLHSSE